MIKYIVLILLVDLFTFMPIYSAKADIINEFIQVQCLEELNTLKIDAFNANGALPREKALQNHEQLWKQKKIILHDALMERDPNFKWQQSRPIETQCTLYEEQASEGNEKPKLEKQTYFITLEPYLFNANPQWECGGAHTFEVTIRTKARVLVDHFRFWYDCTGQYVSGMNDQTTYTLRFLPHEGYISFNGGYFNLMDKGFHRTFWLRDELPITTETVYSKEEP